MAEPLKNFYNERLVRSLARELAKVSKLDETGFVKACLKGLDLLELTPRAWHIAEALRAHLPADFRATARILVKALGPEQEQSEQFGMEPFRYLPFIFYVQKYGLSVRGRHASATRAHQAHVCRIEHSGVPGRASRGYLRAPAAVGA